MPYALFHGRYERPVSQQHCPYPAIVRPFISDRRKRRHKDMCVVSGGGGWGTASRIMAPFRTPSDRWTKRNSATVSNIRFAIADRVESDGAEQNNQSEIFFSHCALSRCYTRCSCLCDDRIDNLRAPLKATVDSLVAPDRDNRNETRVSGCYDITPRQLLMIATFVNLWLAKFCFHLVAHLHFPHANTLNICATYSGIWTGAIGGKV